MAYYHSAGVATLLAAFLCSPEAFSQCPKADIPHRNVDDVRPVEIVTVGFSQKALKSEAYVVVRNISAEELRGVVIQVELLGQGGNLLSTFRAAALTAGEGPSARQQLQESVLAEKSTSLSWVRSLTFVRWDNPLLPGQEAFLDAETYVLLASCPKAARVSVVAILTEQAGWKGDLEGNALPQDPRGRGETCGKGSSYMGSGT